MNRKDITTLSVLDGCEQAYKYKQAMSWELIQKETSAPEKVIYAAMQREDDRGYLEWGASLRTAWLSAAGVAQLAELRQNAPAKEALNVG